MSTAQHTPGPWVPCYTTLGQTVLSWHIAGNQHGSSLPICVSDKFSDSRDQNQEVANASLVSKAPEMFDLLAELIDTEGAQPGTSEWAQRVHALLAKIKGETA